MNTIDAQSKYNIYTNYNIIQLDKYLFTEISI